MPPPMSTATCPSMREGAPTAGTAPLGTSADRPRRAPTPTQNPPTPAASGRRRGPGCAAAALSGRRTGRARRIALLSESCWPPYGATHSIAAAPLPAKTEPAKVVAGSRDHWVGSPADSVVAALPSAEWPSGLFGRRDALLLGASRRCQLRPDLRDPPRPRRKDNLHSRPGTRRHPTVSGAPSLLNAGSAGAISNPESLRLARGTHEGSRLRKRHQTRDDSVRPLDRDLHSRHERGSSGSFPWRSWEVRLRPRWPSGSYRRPDDCACSSG